MDRRQALHTAHPDLPNGVVFVLKPSYQMAIDCSLSPREVIMYHVNRTQWDCFFICEHDRCMTHSDSSNPGISEDTTRGICLPS